MSGDDREVERARRIGLNEAVFREINERLNELAEKFSSPVEPIELVCECGNVHCDERLRVDGADYEALRSDSRLFAVVPGHEIEDVEDVVEHRDGYVVVRKHEGEPSRVARVTDPRND